MMIVTVKPLKVKVKQSHNAIYDFMHINTSTTSKQNQVYSKDVLFVRYIGISASPESYVQDILNIDKHFSQISASFPYLRLSTLDAYMDYDTVTRLSKVFDNYHHQEGSSNNKLESKQVLFLTAPLDNPTLEWSKKLAFDQVLSLYNQQQPNSNATIYKNFCVKFLFWMETYLPKLFKKNVTTCISPKLVFTGDIKRHELLFLYFLSRLGCDILYMNYRKDIDNFYPEVAGYSTLHNCGKLYNSDIIIPPFFSLVETRHEVKQVPNVAVMERELSGNLQIVSAEDAAIPKQGMYPADGHSGIQTEEYSYEQLAMLSTSVVMISVYDSSNKVFASGSGVVIHQDGYILTNFHVVEGGSRFSVLFENDKVEYTCNNVVKYHTDYDLAILKVDKQCISIAVNSDEKLHRGQKIVAIGSPLGLFNSISDGIVSGFRNVNHMPMIQFTAPISSGSSGGALLSMYGKLVGLITAGFENGQNLNLAVPADIISFFAKSYI